ncbi:hypothetical protein V8C44DRAFT_318965 [Trichoderma aethiopicum]
MNSLPLISSPWLIITVSAHRQRSPFRQCLPNTYLTYLSYSELKESHTSCHIRAGPTDPPRHFIETRYIIPEFHLDSAASHRLFPSVLLKTTTRATITASRSSIIQLQFAQSKQYGAIWPLVIHIVAVLAQLGERQTEVPPNFNLQKLSEGRVFKPHRSQSSFLASVSLVSGEERGEILLTGSSKIEGRLCVQSSAITCSALYLP